MGVGYGIVEGFYRHVICGIASDSGFEYTHSCVLRKAYMNSWYDGNRLWDCGSFYTHDICGMASGSGIRYTHSCVLLRFA